MILPPGDGLHVAGLFSHATPPIGRKFGMSKICDVKLRPVWWIPTLVLLKMWNALKPLALGNCCKNYKLHTNYNYCYTKLVLCSKNGFFPNIRDPVMLYRRCFEGIKCVLYLQPSTTTTVCTSLITSCFWVIISNRTCQNTCHLEQQHLLILYHQSDGLAPSAS